MSMLISEVCKQKDNSDFATFCQKIGKFTHDPKVNNFETWFQKFEGSVSSHNSRSDSEAVHRV